ncbi:MAG: YcjF family protein [Chlorobiaceae bacterium]|nr:YcjF family protein [Chlorobiaceae bacterium]
MKENTDETYAEVVAESVNDTLDRDQRVEKHARNHILTAMGIGLFPLPIIDMVALVGVQLDMIRTIANEYNVPFRRDLGKSVITTLLGGFVPVALGGTLASLIKCIPLIGQSAGAVTMPVVAGAATYAISRVFIQHFESGGTFLDMDPAKVKSHFAEQFEKGKKVATDLKKEGKASPAN